MSKVWFITGTSRGLGRAFVEAALAAGERVAATARNLADLNELRRTWGEQLLPLALDVTSQSQADSAIERTIATFGRIDVLVNNAGYGNVAAIEDTTLNEFRAQIETNLFGGIIVTKAVRPYFREQRTGHIFQITSIAGRLGPITDGAGRLETLFITRKTPTAMRSAALERFIDVIAAGGTRNRLGQISPVLESA